MNSAAWVLMALTHVNGGAQTSFQEFANRQACVQAADALLKMAAASSENLRVNCVSVNGSAF